MTTFGLHTGVQNTTAAELRELWAGAEELGFDAISVWDHLYSSDLSTHACHEAVAIHAALACATTRVRCGCLVYCAGYRNPGVLAKAVTTIDHLSGGRAEIGLGAGWAAAEHAAFGLPFPPVGERFDRLEEQLEVVTGLWATPAGSTCTSPTAARTASTACIAMTAARSSTSTACRSRCHA